jgi:hypothetical protein
VKEARLVVRSLGDLDGDALAPVVHDGFRAGSFMFRFTRDARGQVDGMTVDAFDVHKMRWTKRHQSGPL